MMKIKFSPALFSRYVVGAWLLLTCISTSSLAEPSQVEEQSQTMQLLPLPEGLWYEGFWSGLHVGDAVAETKQSPNGDYTIIMSIDSRGLVGWVSKFYSRTETVGKLRGEKGFKPEMFRTHFNSRKEPRNITLFYTEDGTIPNRQYDPMENRAKRPDVPEEQRANTLDPLTLILEGRRQMYDAIVTHGPGAELEFQLYDGRRLSTVYANYIGRFDKRFPSGRKIAHKIEVTREAVAGFTGRELERMKEEEPVVTIYMSADNAFLPLQLRGDAMKGTAFAHLRKSCARATECMKAAEIENRHIW